MSAFRKILKTAVGIAAPIVGAFVGGPIGAKIGGTIGAAFTQRSSLMPGPMGLPPSLPGAGTNGGGMVQVANPVTGVIGGAVATGMRWLIGPRGIARNALGKMVGVMRGTSLFRNKRIIALARQIGIQGAALALGITIVEVSEAFVSEAGKRRRARGISGRDIRVTRRTIGKIRGVERDLAASGICRPRASRSRGAANITRVS